MELFMTYLPHHTTEPDLIDALSSVLHNPPLASYSTNPVNFSVNVFSNRNRKTRKLSTNADITIADASIAQHFLDTYGHPRSGPTVKGVRTRMFISKRPVDALRLAQVRANPFVSPATERQRISELQRLKEPIPLTRIDYGRIVKEGEREIFSSEWESSLEGKGGKVYLDGTTRTLVVETAESGDVKILIPISSISTMQALPSGTSILLSLNHSPIYHKSAKARSTGTSDDPFDLTSLIRSIFSDSDQDRRASGIDEAHAEIAQFCSTRILLTFPSKASLDEFKHRRSDALRLPKVKGCKLVVEKLGRYSRIRDLQLALPKLSIPVAFQLDQLLHSETFDVTQLLGLVSTIRQLELAHGPLVTERILQQFGMQQTEGRSESWRYDANGEAWFDDNDFDEAKPFGNSTFKRRNSASTTSATPSNLKSRLIQLATRSRSILESSLFTRQDLFLCRHVILTPSCIVLEGPFPDDSNSIVRRYPSHGDHFLRVSIRDEDGSMLSHTKDIDISRFLRERFAPFFKSNGGLEIAGRHFDFLGYSQSALREHSTWFITPFVLDGRKVTAATIRESLGDFSAVIDIPARYMARLAQAFSATQPSLLLEPHQIVQIADIESPSGSCHTDGVGRISSRLAGEVDEVLRAARPSKRTNDKSTCYQIRLAGAKGMVSEDPLLQGKVLQLRPSQIKFEGRSRELDIADTFSRPLPCYLNRPLIKILEDLGLPISTFRSLQDDAVARIHKATTSLSDAAALLERTGLGERAKLPSLLTNLGALLKLKPNDLDPFLKHCEGLAVAEALKSLKFKARIPLPTCVTLVGVADEDGWLAEGEIYACVKRPNQEPFYLKGDVCISRSPSIHPGDVQVVTAVGEIPETVAPRLRALVNCVVFSVQGNRSLPSCLGGGDLDGDIYQLITLPELIPDRSNLATPAAYSAPVMTRLNRPATIDDGVDFFLGYITSDLMGATANRHLQLSDYYPEGTRHPQCIQLAKMHSDAVDYPKTGTPVDPRSLPKSPSNLKPQFMCGEYWAHQKRGEGKLYYTSDKALGQLFRAIPLKDVTLDASANELESELLDPSSSITNAIITAHLRLDLGSPSLLLSSFDQELVQEMKDHLYDFCDNLLYFATINSLSTRQDRYLTEAEALLGYLSAPAKNPRLRQDKAAKLQRQTDELFEWVRGDVIGYLTDEDDEDVERHKAEILERLERCWIAWLVAKNEEEWYGVRSFGFVVLQLFLDLLKKLE